MTASSLQALLAERRSDFIAFVEARVLDRALAEDLVQGTYARALPHAADVRDEAVVVAWFYRALQNALVDRHRRNAAEARALATLAAELDGHLDASAARVCPCVLRIASELKPEYAEALQRMEVDGDAVKAFAAERGISSSNASVRVFRAWEALRRGVLAACGACANAGCTDCTCGA